MDQIYLSSKLTKINSFIGTKCLQKHSHSYEEYKHELELGFIKTSKPVG